MEKYKRKYNEDVTLYFTLLTTTGDELKVDAAFVAGDIKIMRDGAAESQTSLGAGTPDLSTLVTDEGQGYSIALDKADVAFKNIVIYIVDQGTKVWADDKLVLETFGNAAAQYPERPDLNIYRGYIWLNSNVSNTNAVEGVDGHEGNPVSTIGAAASLASKTGIQKYMIMDDSSFNLDVDYDDWDFEGRSPSAVINFNGKKPNNCKSRNLNLRGNASTPDPSLFTNCLFSVSPSGLKGNFINCGFNAFTDITLAGACYFLNCYSYGTSSSYVASFALGAGSIAASFNNWNGDIEFKNGSTDDYIFIFGRGTLTIDASCTSLNLYVRGNFRITDNGTTTVINQDANLDNITLRLPDNYIMGSSVKTGKDDEIDAIFNKLPFNYIMGSSNQADYNDEIGAILAFVSRMHSNIVLVNSTINSTGRTTTSCRLDSGSSDDGAYVGMKVVLSGSGDNQNFVSRTITSYIGTTKTVTWTPAIDTVPGIEDEIYIIPGDTQINPNVINIQNRIPAVLQSGRMMSNVDAFGGNADVDGETLSVWAELMLAMANGRFKKDTPVVGQLTIFKRDNITPLTILNVTDTERTRIS